MAEKFITRQFWADLTNQDPAHYVSLNSYASHIQAVYTELDNLGYDIVDVIPITRGLSEECLQKGGRYVGDVGFSITLGAVVVGKKRD